MSVDADTLRAAVQTVSGIRGVRMNPDSVADDVISLATAIADEEPFTCAVANTARAIQRLAVGKVEGTPLTGVFEGWSSFHFQSERKNGASANMRVVYRRNGGVTEVLGFGHRWLPSDVYAAISSRT